MGNTVVRTVAVTIAGGLFNTGLTVSGYVNPTLAVLCWSLMVPVFLGAFFWPRIRGFLRWGASRIRRYSWSVGVPIAFGLLLGGTEWLISNLLYRALEIGLLAFALALLSFIVWARKQARDKGQITQLTTDVNTRAQKVRGLERQRIEGVKSYSFLVSEYLKMFLEHCKQRELDDQEVMQLYNQEVSGKPVGAMNSLKEVELWRPKEQDKERFKYPENPQDIVDLCWYLRRVGLER